MLIRQHKAVRAWRGRENGYLGLQYGKKVIWVYQMDGINNSNAVNESTRRFLRVQVRYSQRKCLGRRFLFYGDSHSVTNIGF